MRKFVTWIILVPLAVIIVLLAVANRQIVTFTLDPLGSTDTSSVWTFSLPLFALAFVFVIAGVIVGGVAAWLRQSKWRRAARRAEAEVRTLHVQVDDLKRQLAQAEAALRPAEPPKVALQPPAA
jgi:uncharacterized integral membrane protein